MLTVNACAIAAAARGQSAGLACLMRKTGATRVLTCGSKLDTCASYLGSNNS
jgi:hypothetical protein